MHHNQIIAFHTCSNKNNESIVANAPFLCENRKDQWLGVGFYFWPDSDYFAHEWGKSYKNGYVITKFTIDYPNAELLDLVGNVEHNIWFIKRIDFVLKKLEEIYKNERDNKKLQTIKRQGVNISEVFWFLRKLSKRNNSIFPYKLVKAGDSCYRGQTIRFVQRRGEEMTLLQRIQLVVYPEAKGYINDACMHYNTESKL